MVSNSTVYIVDVDGARETVIALVRQKGLQAEGFSSVDDFLANHDPTRKGCVVIDIGMAGVSGLELLQKINSRQSSLPVVVLAGQADVPMAVRAMQQGAVTFLEKPFQEEELWQAIVMALEIEQTQHTQRKKRAEIEARLATLSPDELETLHRLLAGQANKRIAIDLDLGLRTIELRRANIMKKMQAGSFPDLVRMAVLLDMLKPEDLA